VEDMKTLTLTLIGRDSWDRPVYEIEGRLYVDTDPRSGKNPRICTKQQFDGEPINPIADDINIEFIPRRDTW
jgi:hypothetical protein